MHPKEKRLLFYWVYSVSLKMISQDSQLPIVPISEGPCPSAKNVSIILLSSGQDVSIYSIVFEDCTVSYYELQQQKIISSPAAPPPPPPPTPGPAYCLCPCPCPCYSELLVPFRLWWNLQLGASLFGHKTFEWKHLQNLYNKVTTIINGCAVFWAYFIAKAEAGTCEADIIF